MCFPKKRCKFSFSSKVLTPPVFLVIYLIFLWKATTPFILSITVSDLIYSAVILPFMAMRSFIHFRFVCLAFFYNILFCSHSFSQETLPCFQVPQCWAGPGIAVQFGHLPLLPGPLLHRPGDGYKPLAYNFSCLHPFLITFHSETLFKKQKRKVFLMQMRACLYREHLSSLWQWWPWTEPPCSSFPQGLRRFKPATLSVQNIFAKWLMATQLLYFKQKL